MVPPSDLARSIIDVTVVGAASPVEVEPGADRAAGRLEATPTIELAGVAPGGSAAAIAPRRQEWARQAMDQRQSWAPRAPDWAVSLEVLRPEIAGRPRSPAEIVAHIAPGDDDLWLAGPAPRDDSVLRRRGDRDAGERVDEPGAAGTPSNGNRVALGDGTFAPASAGEGGGPEERMATRGGRPRHARPLVAQAPTSSDAERGGDLAGMQQSRQAAPEVAWSSTPVREARRSSGEGPPSEALAAGAVRRSGGQGAGRDARGPAGGGRGRGTRGEGRDTSPLLDSYLDDCIARIGRQWSYPRDLAYDLQQDLVLLEVHVRHDGRVEEVTVQRSSGFVAFDETAVRAVRLASPLAPPPPEELFRHGRNFVVLHLSMRYRNPMFE
jgi:TonB family protein